LRRPTPPLHNGALMQPNFNAEERYILAYYKSDSFSGQQWGYWIVFAAVLFLFVYGIGIHDEGIMFCAFGILLVFNIFSMLRRPRYFRINRSIFDKYEKRIEEMTKASE
jgi:hypothetical protein